MKELTRKISPGTRVAMAYVDLETHAQAAVHAEDCFESASLVKLPVLVELFARVQEGKASLDEELTLEHRFRVGGSGSLKDQPDGTRWSLGKLADLMITQSDNIATDMLMDRLGMKALQERMAALGLKGTTVQRTIFDFGAIDRGQDNRTCAQDMAALLESMAQNKLPGSQEMLKILEGQERHDMIPAGLPSSVRVAHKTGELTGVLHDAGIVETPQGSYVLVLLSSGFPDRGKMVRFWAEASRRIYRAYLPKEPPPPPQSTP